MVHTIALGDGKYTFKHDDETGALVCLRYGGNWRNFTGDGAVLSLVQKIQDLDLELLKLKNQLDMTKEDHAKEIASNKEVVPTEGDYHLVINRANNVVGYGHSDKTVVEDWAKQFAEGKFEYSIISISLNRPGL